MVGSGKQPTSILLQDTYLYSPGPQSVGPEFFAAQYLPAGQGVQVAEPMEAA